MTVPLPVVSDVSVLDAGVARLLQDCGVGGD